VRSHPITANLSRINFGWGLSLVVFRAGVTWDTDGEVIYVGTHEDVAEFRRHTDGRSKRRAAYPREIADRLTHPVRTYLIKTKLPEAAAEFARESGVRIEIISDALHERQITLATGELPLDVILDLVCLHTDANWQTESNKVVIWSRD
jgi:hypothetical protein